MRINDPPPPGFAIPDTADVRAVDRVRPVRAVEGEAARAVLERREAQAPFEYRPAPGQPGFVEGRMRARREAERRQRRLPVVMDTRSGQDRRQRARRATDAPPPRVDITA